MFHQFLTEPVETLNRTKLDLSSLVFSPNRSVHSDSDNYVQVRKLHSIWE